MSPDIPRETVEALLEEVNERLQVFESSLPNRVDVVAVSAITKLPSKALLYREALIWRMVELGRSAFESFKSSKLASAILLTRAAVETSAALWYLRGKVETAIQSGVVADIDEYLMKLLMGSKNNPDLPDPINVMTFVGHVDKKLEGFRQQYDGLSEFAHPNWAGTALLYSKPDPANLWTDFGPNIRAKDSTKLIGVGNLSVALMMFEVAYNRIGELIPEFAALCERHITSSETDKPTTP